MWDFAAVLVTAPRLGCFFPDVTLKPLSSSFSLSLSLSPSVSHTLSLTLPPKQHIHPMTTSAHAALSTGAYVIRERVTAAALQLQSPNIDSTSAKVTVSPQDESQFPDQQIWWVEPLAEGTGEVGHGSVYSITNPCGYKALTGNADGMFVVLALLQQLMSEPGTVSATQQRGARNQMWALRTMVDTVSG